MKETPRRRTGVTSSLNEISTHCKKRSDLCIPRNESKWPRSQFPHYCICERFMYPKIGPPILLQQTMQTDRGRIQIDHRCINVGMGTRPRSFISGIFFNFRYGVFAVRIWKEIGWWKRGRRHSTRPPPFYSRLLDRSWKTTWTVFPPSRIFALWWRPVRFTSFVAGLKKSEVSFPLS